MTEPHDGDVALIRLLGPIEARVGGLRVDLGPPKRRLLLALLALDRGQAVPIERLINLVWEAPPPAARRVVFAHVARLRKALASGADSDIRLVSSRNGYVLHAPPESVDAEVFRRLVAEAATVAEPNVQSALLQQALALWRGPALEDLVVTPLAEPVVRGLDELRLAAMEDRIQADLDAGRHAAVVIELAGLVAKHPLRERLAGQLMLALYRGGAPAKALEVYRQLRLTLADELGLDPGPELTDLNQAILRRQPLPAATAAPAVSANATPARIASPPRHQLDVPAQLPPGVRGFAARTAELHQLDAWLASAHAPNQPALVATISGTAGVGKTALAVHWAHRIADQFPDGQLYVNLRGYDPTLSVVTPTDAVRGILDAFGIPAERIPADVEAQIGLYRTVLAGLRVLIVLDNAADSEHVRPLLPGSSTCAVVVTSRDRLTGLVTTEGARPLTLATLPVNESQQLLADRLGAARLSMEPDAVSTIIARCAGLPLALAIVAAQAATHPGLPLAALAKNLHGGGWHPDVLNGGDPYTQLSAVFSWSYHQLTPAAARLFRLLGLHCGLDFPVAAAASLAGTPIDQAQAALTELCRAHLLDELTPGRYTFHDLLRAYAMGQTHGVDTEAARLGALRRILDHYLDTAQAAALLLSAQPPSPQPPSPDTGPPATAEPFVDQQQALDWFVAEHRVLVGIIASAATAGFPHHAWRLACTCTSYLERLGHWQDLVTIQRAALLAAQNANDSARQAEANYSLARTYTRIGRHDDAGDHFRQALDLFAELGDQIRQASRQVSRGDISLSQGAPEPQLARIGGERTGIRNPAGWHQAPPPDQSHCHDALALQREITDSDHQATR